MNRTALKIKLLGMGIAVSVTFASCGKDSGSKSFDPESVIGPSCQVATDQRLSFMPKVPGFPMELRVDNSFTRREQADIAESVEQWNALGRRVMGVDFFTVKLSTTSAVLRARNPRECGQALGTQTAFSIVRESSESHWKELGFSNSIPGATIRCHGGGTDVSSQVVMIYTSVIEPTQFTSVIVHELGHVLGLDHSCKEGAVDAEKYRACSSLHLYHSYRTAVMYPSLELHSSVTGEPEVKDTIKANDILRTECMYAP